MHERRPIAGAVRHGLALALCFATLAGCGQARTPLPSPILVDGITPAPLGVRDTEYDPPRPAPALVLTDQDGRPFDLASLRGTPVFVYFGYTHCPDVCPTTLADLRAALELTSVQARVVFVTVDPARDDVAAMRQYVGWYAASFIGLTGTEAQIAAAADAWGVSYRREDAGSTAGYAMSHSTETYLVDGDGQLRHHLFFGATPELIASKLEAVSG